MHMKLWRQYKKNIELYPRFNKDERVLGYLNEKVYVPIITRDHLSRLPIDERLKNLENFKIDGTSL